MKKLSVILVILFFTIACSKKHHSDSDPAKPSPADSVTGTYSGLWRNHQTSGNKDTVFSSSDTSYPCTIHISKVANDSILVVSDANYGSARYPYYGAGISTGYFFISHSSRNEKTLIYYTGTDSLYFTSSSESHNYVAPYNYHNNIDSFSAKRQ